MTPTGPSVADDALERLAAGNERYVRRASEGAPRGAEDHSGGQSPFAVVLGCSDSRVPPEIVFDQGVGDLFVVRVAGNLATAATIGSVEFGTEQLGARLVVVLGHSECGAVAAATRQLEDGPTLPPSPLREVVDRVARAIAPALGEAAGVDPAERAVRANVAQALDELRSGSEVVRRLEGDGRLRLAGAVCAVDTGRIDWLDG